MTIWLLSYTARGRALAARVADILKSEGHGCRTFALPKFCGAGDEPLTLSAADWAGQGFAQADALVFCCAAGIAVRAIAPHVRDKRTDPAVLVLDEGGTFVIPLLSGHLGGANALALDLADKLSGGEYKDIDDFKKSVREKLEQDNETNYNREVYSAIFQQLLKLYPVDKYPQEFIDYYVNTSMNQLQQQAEDESETLDDMLKSVYNTDADSMKAYFKTYAEQLLQQRIILGVIAQKENITLSDDDFQSAVEGYAQQYGISVDDFLSYYSEKDIRESELENRVMEFLASKAKITETDETEIETEELEVETEAGQTEAGTSSAEADTES